ncbi:hypothetical protein [Thalassotalea montiporae]
MKKLAMLVSSALTANLATAADVNYEQLHKQLDIMSNIIESSITTGKAKQSIKLSGIESTYLQKQGVMFTVRSKSSRGSWGSYNFQVSVPPVPPAPPITLLSPDQIADIEATVAEVADEYPNIDVEREVAKAMESASRAYERVIEIHRDEREVYRDLREEERDIVYELRDVERENRDVEFQIRRADKEQKAELKEKQKQLEKQKKALLESKQALAKRGQEFRVKQAESAKKSEQARQSYFTQLSGEIAEALCLYGNGLKALPKGEYVTVVLKSGGDRVGRHYQDKIHVFSKRDINGCATDKITTAQLLEKSSAYQF